jgi:hypothetical protein
VSPLCSAAARLRSSGRAPASRSRCAISRSLAATALWSGATARSLREIAPTSAPPLDQQSRGLGLPEERGEVKGGEAVSGPGLRVGQAVERAESGRVELVERRVGVADRRDDVVVPVVARAQECGDALVVVGGGLRRIAREQLADAARVAGSDQLEDLHRATIRA